jgi:hypothetical protein
MSNEVPRASRTMLNVGARSVMDRCAPVYSVRSIFHGRESLKGFGSCSRVRSRKGRWMMS